MTERVRRTIDRSDQVARAALADALSFFPGWREDLARFAIIAGRGRDRAPMLRRCDEIAREVAEVRQELILTLAEAPPRVSGNSRVVDMERALDNIEAALHAVQARLRAPG